MIDINKLNELEKEVRDLKDTILKQVWLVHHIVGVDFNSEVDAIDDIDISTCGLVYFNCTVTPKYDIRLSYQQTLFIDKTLLTMSDEEFNNLTVGDFSRSKYKPITFEGLI